MAIVFEHVDVFDAMDVSRDQTVLIVGPVITAISRSVEVPADAMRVDGVGKTLLPGLIDGHTHTFSTDLRQALIFGVTTELDMFTDPRLAATLKRRNAEGEAPDIPDLLSAGLPVTAPGGHLTQYAPVPIPTLDRPEEAQSFVDARVAEGSDYIKIAYDDGVAVGRKHPTTGRSFTILSRDTLAAAIAAAHARDKRAIVHISAQQHARDAVEAGADGLAHLFVDQPPAPDFADLLAKRGVFVITTLGVRRASTGAPIRTGLLEDPQIRSFLDETGRKNLETTVPVYTTSASYRFSEAELRQLISAHVPVVAGTDAPLAGGTHGASLHAELELLVNAGMTPLKALAAATSAPAQAFGLHDRGRMSPGLRADLVLVDGDPTIDIRATRAIAGVWKRGVAVDRTAAIAG